MSAEVRAVIAAAATLGGINAQPYFVQTSNPGTGLVRLDRIEYPNRFGAVAFWSVVVLLPQDLAASEKYFEETIPAVRDALAEVLVVTTITPQLIDFGSGSVPCAVISGHREE